MHIHSTKENESTPSQIRELENNIIEQCKKSGYDNSFVQKGIVEARRLHEGQFRKSGDPYIIHPLHVAQEIAELDLGENAVIAALLHDTIEDCAINAEYIEGKFNNVIANLVEGVTKLDEIADNSIVRYTELMNVRKLLIASSQDIRVLLIKLADRLHNMRTIDALPRQKKIDYSIETLKVYVPLAEYIGIGKWKRELEDIAFRKKEPELYHVVQEKISLYVEDMDQALQKIQSHLASILKKNDIKHFKVFGRIKSANSTYNKFVRKLKSESLEDIRKADITIIKDIIAFSIILNSHEMECYKLLGIIHKNFEYLDSDFVDYIAKPKPNGYRSIHTIVFIDEIPVEVQIKTHAMHEVNEFGPASHIAYKLSGKKKSSPTSAFSWIKNLQIWNRGKQRESRYKFDAFQDKIFVITPKGRVIELRKGAVTIDFAYAIHSEVGNRFVGAKINDRIAKVDSKLSNGDVVEILTSKSPKLPSPEWSTIAAMNSTRQKIRRFSQKKYRFEAEKAGEAMISEYIQEKLHVSWQKLDMKTIEAVCQELGQEDSAHLYLAVHSKSISRSQILKTVSRLIDVQQPIKTIKKKLPAMQKDSHMSPGGIAVEGEQGLKYRLAGCCKPFPGDDIVGIVTLRDGLKVHRKVCAQLQSIPPERILQANWLGE